MSTAFSDGVKNFGLITALALGGCGRSQEAEPPSPLLTASFNGAHVARTDELVQPLVTEGNFEVKFAIRQEGRPDFYQTVRNGGPAFGPIYHVPIPSGQAAELIWNDRGEPEVNFYSGSHTDDNGRVVAGLVLSFGRDGRTLSIDNVYEGEEIHLVPFER